MITNPGTTREVIAAVGTHQYYRQRGFAMGELYRVKELERTCR
jgi:histone acetyltransferase (RNA polymerase elongator complex component)